MLIEKSLTVTLDNFFYEIYKKKHRFWNIHVLYGIEFVVSNKIACIYNNEFEGNKYIY
jgi:hypothetical protein